MNTNVIKLFYELIDELLYCKKKYKFRLYISFELKQEIFKLIYNEMNHSKYVKTHEKLITGLFIYNIIIKLHEYIHYCPHCQMNQIPRHRPYESLQLIYTPAKPFHIIIIDFILILSKTVAKEDYIISIINKFNNVITLIINKI